MSEPMFPIRPQRFDPADPVRVIEPYWHENMWVFDDPVTGLVQEPFVSGVTEMIDRLTTGIVNSKTGFRLLFAAQPFKGFQTSLTWVRLDSVEGNWYRSDDVGDEGWLCPALFCYFPVPPPKIYVKAEPIESGHA